MSLGRAGAVSASVPLSTRRTFEYGPSESQRGDLYLPCAPHPAVVCLLHGGFWRMPYGRDQFAPVAEDLAARGYAVWNIGYRRLGEPGGGWPGTLDDVAAAVDHLAALAEDGLALDLDRVVVAGHSAGGQLALCLSARDRGPGLPGPIRVRPMAAAGLAALTDLASAWALDCGKGAVEAFLGGPPDRHPDRCAAASPIARLPLGVRQLILHGDRDDALPPGLAHDYAAAARASGDAVEFIELAGAGHMDYLDPRSAAHRALCAWLARLGTGRRGGTP